MAVGVTVCRCGEPRVAWGGMVCAFCGGMTDARRDSAPAMELVTGGAQVEAAAHIAYRLLGESLEQAGSGDPTVAAELVERAHSTLAHGLGLPVGSSARSDEEMHELARDEQHLDQIAGRAA